MQVEVLAVVGGEHEPGVEPPGVPLERLGDVRPDWDYDAASAFASRSPLPAIGEHPADVQHAGFEVDVSSLEREPLLGP